MNGGIELGQHRSVVYDEYGARSVFQHRSGYARRWSGVMRGPDDHEPRVRSRSNLGDQKRGFPFHDIQRWIELATPQLRAQRSASLVDWGVQAQGVPSIGIPVDDVRRECA